jgi:hypothetical protein
MEIERPDLHEHLSSATDEVVAYLERQLRGVSIRLPRFLLEAA